MPGESDPEMYGNPDDGQPVDDETQLQPQDTLDDRGVDDVLDEGYSPPDREPAHLRNAPTGAEQHQGETLDERLAQEEPDPDPYAEAEREDDGYDPDSTADPRAGRLVAPDEGLSGDTEKDAIADDVGIDGGAAGAEEAAVHVISEDDL